MKKILLTGGNGFIGKNILESPLAQKYEITAPRSFELNLTDTENVDEFFKNKNFDVVLHSAVKPGHRNAKDRSDLFYSNVRMFQNLERHKDKFGKFINLGSGAIYDVSADIKDAKESDIFKKIPADEHGFCKYTIAKLIEKSDTFIDLNIFGIFGKHEDFQIRFISNAICKTLLDLPITLRQNRKFSYLYIDDLMPILEFFIENDARHKSYNAVPDMKIDLAELAEKIKTFGGKNQDILIASPGYGLEYTGSNARLKNEMPNLKFTDIDKSIKTLFGYYQDNISLLDRNLFLEDK
ncbi:MAG: NAD-dependent epimerase/dehydratase family protein [Endomicrobia bacterium]|nr:NAD-dependent epimerase/dehydratase family protein [Endomicrobiia bacterium]